MDFPDDVFEEILLRMPVKSVMRFKLLSTSWNNTISDVTFRRRYLSLQDNEKVPSGFFYHNPRPEFLASGPCMPGVGPAKFINTSNVEREELNCLNYLHELGYVLAASKGLLLLSRNPMSYHVYDLVSKKYIKLPRTLTKHPYVAVGFICYEYEPVEHNTPFRLSYKVVRVGGKPVHLFQAKTKSRTVETYSSETGKWQKSIMTAASEFCLGPQSVAKVIGGVFHWVEFGTNRVVAYNSDDPKKLVKLIELPWDMKVDLYSAKGFEGTQNGCLQFYNIYLSIDVWILKGKQEGGSYLDDEDVIESNRWILTHRISFLDLGFPPPYFVHDFPFPIAISPWNCRQIFLHRQDEILLYDQVDRKIEVVSSHHIDHKYTLDMFVAFQWPIWPCL